MIIADPKHLKGVEVKDAIINMLLERQMTYKQIEAELKLGGRLLDNHLTQLKKRGFIVYAQRTSNTGPRGRPYYAVPGMGTYKDYMYNTFQRKYERGVVEKDPMFSPHASMKHKADDHHPARVKTKVSAWSGYSSF